MSTRVFITGVTGYLGSAIAARFVRSSYEVWGLTRNPERAPSLASRGIHPVIGELAKAETFLAPLKNCDVAIHVAFDPADTANQDRLALDAIRLGAQDGRVRRLVYTSGVWVHGDTGSQVADESTALNPLDLVRWRPAHEDVAIDLAEHEVKVVVLRPGLVYGGSRGIFGGMFAEAHERKTVHYPGSGGQRWSLIHRDDLAEAYLRAIERANGGERYIVTDGSSFTARQIAEAIARVTGATVQSRDSDEMTRRFGLFGRAQLTSQRFDSSRIMRELGWTPQHTSFVDEVKHFDEDWQAWRGTPVA